MVVAQIIPPSNMTDASAQDFVLNDKLLLLFLKKFEQRSRSVHGAQNARCFQSVCSNKNASYSYQ
jgi:hypothetical protein